MKQSLHINHKCRPSFQQKNKKKKKTLGTHLLFLLP